MVGHNAALEKEVQSTMNDSLSTYREAIADLVQELPEEYLRSLLDYAEYLRQRQVREDREDIADSERALEERETIPWEEVKRDLQASVQN
jgi:hypothetical protein